jgi:hypothetical protein
MLLLWQFACRELTANTNLFCLMLLLLQKVQMERDGRCLIAKCRLKMNKGID